MTIAEAVRDSVIVALILLTICLCVLVLYFATRPAPLPRIIDEHGNNLVYRCPGDPRCTPVVR